MFPASFVVIDMAQHKSYQQCLVGKVDFADKPIGIPFDIENSADTDKIRVREFVASLSQVLPLLSLGNSVPST
jgi:hypothetical protein